MTLYAAEQRSDSTASDAPRPLADQPWWPWAWMLIAVAFLLPAGLVRTWQDRRFQGVEVKAVAPMFPLKSLPTSLQGWEAQEGEASLDPQIARIAGSTDSLIRNYIDSKTGVVVTVLVLYGRADQVVAHTPEVCYPAVGYQLAEHITDEVLVAGGLPSIFRSTVYAKKAATVERQEVFYTFRQGGTWSPQVAGNWRTLRNSPAAFKVQVQRRIGDTERRHLFNPTKQFLAAFLPQLEQRIREAEGRPPGTAEEPAGAGGGPSDPARQG